MKSNFYQKLFSFKHRRFIRASFYLIKYFPRHFFCFINFLSGKETKSFEHNLAIATIIKNEGPYLKEWLEYHMMLGVTKFIIQDNESNDDTKDILKPYIESGIVDYTWFPGYKMQLKSNNYAVKKYRNKVKYIALIDIDEFIVPIGHDSIIDLINEVKLKTVELNKPFVGVIIHFVEFGYGGHYQKPEGLVIENYKNTDGITRFYKGIVNPRAVVYYRVHGGDYILNRFTVDENGNDVYEVSEYLRETSTVNKIQINHYCTKSYEEHKIKHNKGGPSTGKRKFDMPEYDPSFLSKFEDISIQRFIPELKRRLS